MTRPSLPQSPAESSALAQQHHLDALALRGRYLPSQRRRTSTLLHLAICSPRNRWPQRITARGPKTIPAAQPPQTFRFKQLWNWYQNWKFAPVTLDHMRSHGCRELVICCSSGYCNHSTAMNVGHLSDDIPIKSLGDGVVCKRCGHVGPDVVPTWP